MLLEVGQLEKTFGDKPVLRGLSFTVASGEIVALLGPSGCGKTTLLRVIAGLEPFEGGHVLYEGRSLPGIAVHERGFGMVFQDYALFPHKDVAGNIEFGLRMQGWDAARREQRISQVLRLVGLEGFDKRKIHELSGGEQQRIALARSLAPSPRLLLLDEPMGSLDRALRERLMHELRMILKEAGKVLGRPEGITAIFVTHDQEEAFAVADRILVMNAGRIEQEGTPALLYAQPASQFVARFLGMDNFLKGEVSSTGPVIISTELGEVSLPAGEAAPGDEVALLMRPESASLHAPDQEPSLSLRARVLDISFRGRYQEVTFEVSANDGSTRSLKFDFDTDVSLPPPGIEITLYIRTAGISIFERDDGG